MATRKQAKAARSNVQKAQQSAYYTSLAEAGQTQNLESPDTPARFRIKSAQWLTRASTQPAQSSRHACPVTVPRISMRLSHPARLLNALRCVTTQFPCGPGGE